MISPDYFENKFVQTFGTVGYWLEKCGIWFAIFVFVKLIIDIIVTVMRTLETHRITGRSVSFGKVLLSATYNFFMVSILNSTIHQPNQLNPQRLWLQKCKNLQNTYIPLSKHYPLILPTLFRLSETTNICSIPAL